MTTRILLLLAGSVDLNGGGVSLHPATLAGGGSVGNVSMQSDTFLRPGNASPNTKLTMSTLGCSGTNNNVYLRIGNDSGGATRGTYLHLTWALQAGTCPYLRFWLTSAGEPLLAGEGYLIATMDSVTDYTTANLGYAMAVAGYPQAHGHFLVAPIAGTSVIFFVIDDIGDRIFADGFE